MHCTVPVLLVTSCDCADVSECDGGREWTECGGGEHCVATCANTMPICPRDCYEGCYCPPDRPVWHHDECITADQCRGSKFQLIS